MKRHRKNGRGNTEGQNLRNSVMLLVIVFLFILVEFPNGIMNVLAGVYGKSFRDVYLKLGDFFDMLTLLYSSINFVLYCTMSSQFRNTFRQVFCLSACCRMIRKSPNSRGKRLANTAKCDSMPNEPCGDDGTKRLVATADVKRALSGDNLSTERSCYFYVDKW